MNKIRRLPTGHSNTRRTGASRSGGMLILVLVILGVGMILITSALSVTIATRNRFYDDAQRSQAKLTVTSAAKTVVDAITVTQELRDAKIEAWAAAGETIYIRSAASYDFDDNAGIANSVAPAIGANTTASNAYTAVTFSNPGGKITMDFVTKIDAGIDGGATEKLRVVLKEKEEINFDGLFPGVLSVGADGTSNTWFNTYVGETNSVPDSPSNVVYLRGNYVCGTGGNAMYSDAVITGIVETGEGFNYFGDVVFLGDRAGLNTGNLAGQGYQVTNGYFVFAGKDGGNVFWKKDGSGVFQPTTFNAGYTAMSAWWGAPYYNIYYNTSFKAADGSEPAYHAKDVFVVSNDAANTTFIDYDVDRGYIASKVHNIGSSNTVSISSNTIANNPSDPAYTQEIKNVLAKYTSTDAYETAEKQLFTEAEARAAYSAVYPGYGAGVTSLNDKLSSNMNITAGNYKVDVTVGTLTGKWTIDLSGGPVKLVLYGSGVFTINNGGMIRVINGSEDSYAYIFLENGVRVSIPKFGSTVQGIISNQDDSLPAWGSGGGTFPSKKPYLFLIGFNNNEIYIEGSCTYLEAYCGLYGSGGKISYEEQVNMYGRFEVRNLINIGGNQPRIPNCRAPWEPEDSGDIPLATKYEVDYYEYY